MKEEVKKRILKSIEATRIDKVNPDKDIVDEALQVDSRTVHALPDKKLTEYIHVLTQHVIYVQVQYNIRKIKYLEAKREYEIVLAEKLGSIKGSTAAERKFKALSENSDLMLLEQEMRVCEADLNLLENIPTQLSELVNAFKKEKSCRMDNYKQKFN